MTDEQEIHCAEKQKSKFTNKELKLNIKIVAAIIINIIIETAQNSTSTSYSVLKREKIGIVGKGEIGEYPENPVK
jgi:hypothetical protein